MTPQARFTGGGELDGDVRELPALPDTYEVTRAGQVWVYERGQVGADGVTVYQLESHRPV